jgi:hypothetical protein
MAIVGFLVQLPLALPPLTSGILLLFLVGYHSSLGRLLGGALTDSFAGIVLSEVFVTAPFLIIAARSSFAAMDAGLEGVAATLGRGPIETSFRVSLPIARPAIASGLLLSWLRAFWRVWRHRDGRLSPVFAAGLHLCRFWRTGPAGNVADLAADHIARSTGLGTEPDRCRPTGAVGGALKAIRRS